MINAASVGDRLFHDDVCGFANSLEKLKRRIGDQPAPIRDESFHELANAIRTMSRKCRLMEYRCGDEDQLRDIRHSFQNTIAPWFDTSWFMSRAKCKPRGYPGDFELLSGIYDGEVRSRGLGGYLDLYFLHSDLGQAVVARMRAAREFLNQEIEHHQGDLTILNVASGPCREFFTGLRLPQADRRITMYCIDSDPEALSFVKDQVGTNGNGNLPNLEFVRHNALRMRSAKSNLRRFGPADIIYSIGLLDYLPDRHLVPILAGLRETLKPNGTVYFAFKDINGYDSREYQWFVDWFFFERDQEHCMKLLCEAGFERSKISVVRDDTGIIMNFVASEKSSARRTDQAMPTHRVQSPHSNLLDPTTPTDSV